MGTQKYLNGDLDGAILDYENALAYNPEDEKARGMLVKVLAEKGKKYYDARDYAHALPSLERAYRLDPRNEELKAMYTLALQATLNASSKAQAAVLGEQPRHVVKSSAEPSVPPARSKESMDQLLEKFQKQQARFLDEAVKSQVKSVVEKQGTDFRRNLINGGLILLVLGVLTVLYFSRLNMRREKVLKKEAEQLLDMIHDQNIVLSKISKSGAPGHQFLDGQRLSIREMMSDPNPHVRARGVELLENDLKQTKVSPEVALRLITPFLKDADNRVRANAAKLLYNYQPREAFNAIATMISSTDEWMQLSAAWVLGEIRAPESAELLLRYAVHPNLHIQKRVIKSLENLVKYAADVLPWELQHQILSAVRKSTGQREKLVQKEVEKLSSLNEQANENYLAGITAFDSEKYEQAIEKFEKSLQCREKWEAYESLGNCYFRIGKINQAIDAFKRSLNLNPENQNLKNWLDNYSKEEG